MSIKQLLFCFTILFIAACVRQDGNRSNAKENIDINKNDEQRGDVDESNRVYMWKFGATIDNLCLNLPAYIFLDANIIVQEKLILNMGDGHHGVNIYIVPYVSGYRAIVVSQRILSGEELDDIQAMIIEAFSVSLESGQSDGPERTGSGNMRGS